MHAMDKLVCRVQPSFLAIHTSRAYNISSLRVHPTTPTTSIHRQSLPSKLKPYVRRSSCYTHLPRRAITAMAASNDPFPSLVSAEWLKQHFTEVKILDATWYMPNQKDKNAIAEYKTERIPGAQYFDLDGVANCNTDLPHMLPSPHQFAAAADALNITNDDTVIIYDRSGIFSSPRAWWTWSVFGHHKVAVLDGGLPAWKAIGGEMESTLITDDDEVLKATHAAQSTPPSTPTAYKATLKQEQVRDRDDVLDNLRSQREQVIDARPALRWQGKAPEPRPGLAKGHIPASVNVPWDSVLTPEGKMRPAQDIQKRLTDACVDLGRRPLVFSCGSGTTACILLLAAKQLDGGEVEEKGFAVYDGSFSEWGKPELDFPVSTTAISDT